MSLIGSVPKKFKKKEKEKEDFNWDSLRLEAQGRNCNEERTVKTYDSSDWESLRTADVTVVSETIKSRGCNTKFAGYIQVQFYPNLVIV